MVVAVLGNKYSSLVKTVSVFGVARALPPKSAASHPLLIKPLFYLLRWVYFCQGGALAHL